ncbi:MAG TPA: DUF2442 domain-containing protein [Armatimonadota bacterium]|nr:DUF2442 domain-containing protein [Armatimonadota bacterium]
MTRVSEVTTLEPFRIRVKFTDGLEGVVDLAPMVGTGVFAPLRDLETFARVYVDPVTHTVAWPGDIDLCPDTMYRDIQAQQRAA